MSDPLTTTPPVLPRGYHRRVKRERTNRLLGILGTSFISLGLLILAFALFQFFGTGLITTGRQQKLHDQFSQQLRQAHINADKHPLGPARTVPTIPQPEIGQPVAEISIPKIHIDFTVLQGTGDVQLEAGPGHYTGTPLPGEIGNAAIAGHRTTWLRPFWNLNELNPGDSIFITTIQGYFRYRVTSQVVVAPTDASVLDPTTNATLTLSTCNPRFSATQRLVVKAVLSASWLPGDSAPSIATTTTRPVSTTTTEAAPQFVTSGSWIPAVVWGIFSALTAALTLIMQRKYRHWWIYLVGAPFFLVALFYFFLTISPLLPPSL